MDTMADIHKKYHRLAQYRSTSRTVVVWRLQDSQTTRAWNTWGTWPVGSARTRFDISLPSVAVPRWPERQCPLNDIESYSHDGVVDVAFSRSIAHPAPYSEHCVSMFPSHVVHRRRAGDVPILTCI